MSWTLHAFSADPDYFCNRGKMPNTSARSTRRHRGVSEPVLNPWSLILFHIDSLKDHAFHTIVSLSARARRAMGPDLMSAPKPTADWERVGDRYYRKIQLYSSVFDPDLELDHYRIVGAPFGGALGMYVTASFEIAQTVRLTDVALHRKEGGIYAYRGGDASKSGVDLYSCSGKLIRKINVRIIVKGRVRNLLNALKQA